MKNPQVRICEPGLALSSILQVCILLMHSIHHGFTQIVTSQQHGEAVLSFHFSFISGPEDLHVTIMKMESIRDTKPTVIYVIYKGAVEYYADQYRNRTEIRNDLPSGKLDLILKHVEESDAGLYKCQAANNKKHDEKMIQLYVEIKERSKHTVTSRQHGEAVLSFHFSFISGPEDLHVTIMKMGSIRDTKPTVIYVIYKGAVEYHAAQYRDRTKIRNDLLSGKLELILKHVKESDAGIYKCQAANKKKHDEKMIQLYVENKERAAQNVTSQQHEAASLSFHFPFISGPEDLHVSFLKMESIDGDTKPAVICALKQGVSVYHAAQYRGRAEIRTDLPSGKLDLILKYVDTSDAGIYKCQAANKKKNDEMMIQLYIEQKIINTKNPEGRAIEIGVIGGIICVALIVCITSPLIICWKRLSLRHSLASQEDPEKWQRSVCEVKPLNSPVNPEKLETIYDVDSKYKIKDTEENNPLYTGRERQNMIINFIYSSFHFSMATTALHHLNPQNQMENVSFQEIPDRGEDKRGRACNRSPYPDQVTSINTDFSPDPRSSTSSLAGLSPKLRQRSGTATRREPCSSPPEIRRRSRSLSYHK